MSENTDETASQNLHWEIFWKIHEGLSQQGPGSDASTRRALAMAGPLPPQPAILDLGCGPGRQTVVLAQETNGTVSAVDLLPPFLAQTDARAAAAGLAEHITTRQLSMGQLDDADASYDLIWSEGAIYNIGFSHGLNSWQHLLRSGGKIAVTEASWLVESPPADITQFWSQHYPGMRDRATNEALVAEAGYRLLDSFVLPHHEWWDHYYTPIEERVAQLRSQRPDAAAQAVLDEFDLELRIVREGLDYFGYVFYVMEKQ